MVTLHRTNTPVRNAIDWVGVLVNPSFYDHKRDSRTTSSNSLIIGIQRIQADKSRAIIRGTGKSVCRTITR
jgi:hypothetical protein